MGRPPTGHIVVQDESMFSQSRTHWSIGVLVLADDHIDRICRHFDFVNATWIHTNPQKVGKL